MPKTITKTYQLFTFDELSDDAKEAARDWYRAGSSMQIAAGAVGA